MCGIVAVHRRTGGLNMRDLDAIETLRHRGPDGVSRWVADSGLVGLAHARLAVIAPADGHQPVTDCSGAVRAVVNGEFYDHSRLRADLVRSGHQLRTQVDSEILVHAYEHDPDDFLPLLRGEFSFVLWDERRRQLLAGRDRFGIKPLFYTEHAGRVLLSSEIKALFTAGVPARWDEGSMHDQLAAGIGPHATLFQGIRQVPPGGLLRIDADTGRIGVERYWQPDFPMLEEPVVEPAAEEIEAAVSEAVRLRLVADYPIALYLSGGMDSSAVAGIAAGLGSAQPAAFTVRFPGAPEDESAIAGRTARALGLAHQVIDIGPTELARWHQATVSSGEMLQENGHAGARMAQAAAVHDAGYRVALAGEGGDELFFGYPQFQQDLRLDLDPAAAARAHQRMALLAGSPAGSATLRNLGATLGFVPAWVLEREMLVGGPIRALLQPASQQRLAARAALAEVADELADQLKGRSAAHRSAVLFYNTWFCNYILAAERLDMASSVELRLPLLDHRLFELARRIPGERFLATGGLSKRPLHRAVSHLLTAEVAAAPKRPFFAPESGWLVPARLVTDQLADGVFDDHPIVSATAVTGLLDRLLAEPSRGPAYDRVLNIVASIGTLQSVYQPGAPA